MRILCTHMQKLLGKIDTEENAKVNYAIYSRKLIQEGENLPVPQSRLPQLHKPSNMNKSGKVSKYSKKFTKQNLLNLSYKHWTLNLVSYKNKNTSQIPPQEVNSPLRRYPNSLK